MTSEKPPATALQPSACPECGAAVLDDALHTQWHQDWDELEMVDCEEFELVRDGLSELTWRWLNDTGQPDRNAEHAGAGRALLVKVVVPQPSLSDGAGE